MHDDTTENAGNAQSAKSEVFEQRIDLPPEGLVELRVRNSQGEVVIRATDRPDVLVHAVKTGSRGSRRYDQADLLVDAERGRIHIRPQVPNNTGFVGFDFGSSKRQRNRRRQGAPHVAFDVGPFGFAVGGEDVAFDITVEIPRTPDDALHRPEIDVRTASGDVLLDGVRGRIGITTASGDADLRAPVGDVTVTTASGDVQIARATGSVAARSASGDVLIRESRLAAFGMTTASGDLDLQADITGYGRCHAESVSGDVRLTLGLPAAIPGGEPFATVEYKTVSGDAIVDPPFRKVGRKVWHSGPGEDGGVRIAVKNVSGDLRLTAHAAGTVTDQAPTEPIGAVPPIPPTPPTPPAPPTPFAGSISDAVQAAMDTARAHMHEARDQAIRAMAEAQRAWEDADWTGSGEHPASRQPTETAASPAAPPTAARPSHASTTTPDEEATAEPAAQPAPTEQDRLAVLQALERGDIDIDEALNRLDAAEPGT